MFVSKRAGPAKFGIFHRHDILCTSTLDRSPLVRSGSRNDVKRYPGAAFNMTGPEPPNTSETYAGFLATAAAYQGALAKLSGHAAEGR